MAKLKVEGLKIDSLGAKKYPAMHLKSPTTEPLCGSVEGFLVMPSFWEGQQPLMSSKSLRAARLLQRSCQPRLEGALFNEPGAGTEGCGHVVAARHEGQEVRTASELLAGRLGRLVAKHTALGCRIAVAETLERGC